MYHPKIIVLVILIFTSNFIFSQTTKDSSNNDSATTEYFSLGSMEDIPNVSLVNQLGENVQFYELIKGKVVALNFIFTTCKTICPPMGANFAALKQEMSDKVDRKEVAMLTISIDPVTDTPDRLLAWSQKFEAGPGWTLLTGDKKDIITLLKKLEVYTALVEEHAPVVLLGKEGEDNWVRANGLADPQELAQTLNGFFEESKASSNAIKNATTTNPDEKYFTNVELVNQYGETMRLYADLMKDKVVIINPFFTECKGICPMMSANLAKIQEYLGDKMGDKVHIISLTVDHETDKQKVLQNYAEEYHASKGWYFMTGEKENIELALKKLGKNVKTREAHDAVFLVGNVETKLWKKVNGLAPVNDIIAQIDSVINDSID